MEMKKILRVGIGIGTFHNPPKVKYNEETKNLIKVLMEESKLSMLQRRSIQGAVDRGESLPLSNSRANKSAKRKDIEQKVMYPSVWKKRSRDLIVKSGAYEREHFRRTFPLVDVETQKRHLACMMAYGKEIPSTPTGPKLLHKDRKQLRVPDDEGIFEELVEGIRERIEFLNDMEVLGLGKKYRPIIRQEVAEKLRIIKSINENRPTGLEKELEKFETKRPPPKPYPLGELDEQ